MITWNTIKDYKLTTDEWKWIFHSFPSLRRIDCYDGNFIQRFWWWLTDPWMWDSSCTPSFARFAKNVVNKILNDCTPWYRLRHRFIEGFVNPNGCKLLSNGFGWTYVRNRQENCAYYTLKFFGFHYRLIRSTLINNKGEACNAFLESISNMLKSEDDSKPSYTEKTELVCSGWVFTRNQAIKELNRIVELTPDLEWIKLDDDGNYIPISDEFDDGVFENSDDANDFKNDESINQSIGGNVIKC